jgi:hypothetical protein
MSKQVPKPSSLGIVLALSYVAFSVFILSQHFEGSWGGFYLFWVSFPASLLASLIAYLVELVFPYGRAGLFVLVIVGTFWWYVVGHYFQYRGRNPK